MKKYERRTYWNYHSRYPNVDWEVNHRRAKRIDQLVRESRLKRQDIARHVGLLPQDLSRLLRSKTVPLSPELALRIEQAVDLLLRRTPRVDWEANHRRAKRIDQLVRESRLKRQDIARHIGLLPQDLSRLLRSKTVPLSPELALRIEQAVDLLLRRTQMRVTLRARVNADPDNAARAARLNRIIEETPLKRHLIAKRAGISPSHLSRVLCSLSTPLSLDMSQRIEQAIHDLLRQARTATSI